MNQRHNYMGLTICIILGLLWMRSVPLFAEQILYVKNTFANVRSGPTAATDNILTTVPEDTPVEMISRQGSWYEVRLPDGREGWISSWVLTAPEDTPSALSGRSLLQGSSQEESRSRPLREIR